MEKKHKKDFEIHGVHKATILSRCYEQITAWGFTMPDDDPLMLHFGLNDFFSIGETEFWICNEPAKGYCGKFIFLFEGQTCPSHLHKIKDETFYVLKGAVNISVNGEVVKIKPGDVLNMPIKTTHSFTAIGNSALILEVSKPCLYQDSYFDDERIKIF